MVVDLYLMQNKYAINLKKLDLIKCNLKGLCMVFIYLKPEKVSESMELIT